MNDITLSEAETLWNRLNEAMATTREVLARIIETRAWEPLGYADFAAAWADRCRGTRLPADCKALVCVAMLERGLSVQQVRRVLGAGSGVTIPVIEHIEEQRISGTPVEQISPRARTRTDADTHIHQNPVRQSRYLTVDLGENAQHYHDLAKGHRMTLPDVTRDLLARWANGEFL
jgi:hypothetical protein